MSNLAPHTPRTLDEQVRYAYLMLLSKVEGIIATSVSEVEKLREANRDSEAEAIQALVDELTFAWSKNVALKTKLLHQ